MKRRLILTLVTACLIGLVAGFANKYPISTSDSSNQIIARANWADVPTTLGELHSSADAVVRVRVSASDNRLLSEILPVYGLSGDLVERAREVPEHILVLEQGMRERGISGTPDQLSQEQVQEILATTTLETQQIGEEVVHTPFTDSTLEVLRVFKGDVERQIVVVQLGGEMPSSNVESGRTVLMEFPENPLLEVGQEYILFLKDSRDNQAHAQGRALYELAAPTGQFRIVGVQVHNPYSVDAQLELPNNLHRLVEGLTQLSQREGLSK